MKQKTTFQPHERIAPTVAFLLLLMGFAFADTFTFQGAGSNMDGDVRLNVSRGGIVDFSEIVATSVNGTWFAEYTFFPMPGADYNYSYSINDTWYVFPATGTIFHPFGARAISSESDPNWADWLSYVVVCDEGIYTCGFGTGNISGAGTTNYLSKFTSSSTIGNAAGIYSDAEGTLRLLKSDTAHLILSNVAGTPLVDLWSGAIDGGNLDLYDSFGNIVVHFGEMDAINYIKYEAYPTAYFGINTKTPSTPLDVNGTSTTTNLNVTGNAYLYNSTNPYNASFYEYWNASCKITVTATGRMELC